MAPRDAVAWDGPFFPVLGTANFGLDPDEATAFRLLDRFVERGGRFIDTARVYSDWVPGETGRSEKLIGRWLRFCGARDRVLLGTKGGHPPMDRLDAPRLAPAELAFDLEQSLAALGVASIDLYWLHRDDERRPIEELLATLESFRGRGLIRAYGASNFSVARLMDAQAVAAARGWPGFAASQPLGCLGARHRQPSPVPLLVTLDDAAERFHAQTGLPLMPYTAQAAGYYEKVARLGVDHPALADHSFKSAGCDRIAAALIELSRRSGHSVSALTLAWWRTKAYPVFPVIGCRTLAQLDDCLNALAVDRATLAELAALDAP